MDKLESSLLLEISNDTTTVANSLTFQQHVKHRVSIWPNNFTAMYIPKKN